MTSQSLSLDCSDETSGSEHEDTNLVARQFVGQEPEPMSDSEREAAAVRAGNAMQAWYSQYQITRDPQLLDRSYEAMRLMRKLLAGRSAEYVARLESERGIA